MNDPSLYIEDNTIALEGEIKTATIILSPTSGKNLQDFLERHTDSRISVYLNKVGIMPSNFYAMIAGRMALSLKNFQKLMSGLPIEMQCQLRFQAQIQDGENVPNVQSATLEDLMLEDQEEL